MSHRQDNPFDDPSNPFEDPSITSALNSNRNDGAYQLEPDPIDNADQNQDEYTSFRQYSDSKLDPFASEHDQKVLIDDDSFQRSGNAAGSSSSPNADLAAREEALRQKERELAQREAILEQQRGRPHANNFPPCFPLMYMDIPAEIPLNHQSTVWWLYREWLLFELTLVLNFIACLCLLFKHPPSVTSAPTDFGISLTEMFTHTLASFFLWYRPVYNAYMKEVSLYYCKRLLMYFMVASMLKMLVLVFYFVFNGFHILYTFYKAIGIPST